MARRGEEMPFDVDAWRSDQALGLLRPASRDFWHEAILIMWKLGKRGVLSGSLNDLAKLCRCSPTEARAAIAEIQARNVADVHLSNDDVTLTNRRMAREWETREKTRKKVAKHRRIKQGLPPLDDDVTGAVTTLYPEGGNRSVTAGFSPASSSPPDPLSNTTLSSGNPVAAQPAAAGKPPTGRAASRRESGEGRQPRARKVTDEQLATKEAFDAWYLREGFPRFHDGIEYPAYDSADAAAAWKVMKCKEIHWDLERAKSLGLFFLAQPEIYGTVGHRLRILGQRLGLYLTKWQAHLKGVRNHDNVNGQHYGGRRGRTAADRGEYESNLPVGIQQLAAEVE